MAMFLSKEDQNHEQIAEFSELHHIFSSSSSSLPILESPEDFGYFTDSLESATSSPLNSSLDFFSAKELFLLRDDSFNLESSFCQDQDTNKVGKKTNTINHFSPLEIDHNRSTQFQNHHLDLDLIKNHPHNVSAAPGGFVSVEVIDEDISNSVAENVSHCNIPMNKYNNKTLLTNPPYHREEEKPFEVLPSDHKIALIDEPQSAKDEHLLIKGMTFVLP